MVLARTQTVDAAVLKTAIEDERRHRGLPPIEAFAAPTQWEGPYSVDAKTVSECDGYWDLNDAVALVDRFLDPILVSDRPQGVWSPNRLSWR